MPLKCISLLFIFMSPQSLWAKAVPTSDRSQKVISSTKPAIEKELVSKGLIYGSPIFIRIFKDTSSLELWVKNGEVFSLFKSYDICTFSGRLGPKTKEGDNQAPEGFYFVTPKSFNPWSSYHLSFNLGYPNLYDRTQGYTGSALMVHGNCVSIGCYAMTDKYINEIYTIATAALNGGQEYFRVHIFPFKLGSGSLGQYAEHKWYSFWDNLSEGYQFFESHKVPPNVTVKDGKYHFERSL